MLIDKLRAFLAKNNIDYLLVNTCDEFLLEYNELKNCPRYILTGFSGSAGEALLTKDKLYLFVDGRYHEQADFQVDKKTVEVVKLKIRENYISAIQKIVKKNSKFALVAKNVPLSHFKLLQSKVKDKNIQFVKLEEDPVFDFVNYSKNNLDKVVNIPLKNSVKSRFDKISKKLKKNEVLFVTNLEEIAYFLNLRSFSIPYSSIFKAKMLISKKDIKLFCDSKNIDLPEFVSLYNLKEFYKYITSENIYLYCPKNINLYDYDLIKKYSKKLLSSWISEMKSVKSNEELKHIKECYKKTDIVVNKVRELVNSDKKISEYDLAEFVKKEFKKLGAKDLSFSSIVAFGTNSSIIHYSNYDKNRYLQDGDFVLLDCGAYFDYGYATDITRTFFRGIPNKKQKQVYTYVAKAFVNAINKKSKSCFTGYSLDKLARKILENKINGFEFSHSLGHGVGICVHEAPPSISSSKSGKTKLVPNMVFTIEPGLYKAGFAGVRLENSVYLTYEKDIYKIKSLSNVPFEEKMIDFSLLNKRETSLLKKLL